MGEIFREEDRKLTAAYKGVIKSIGAGYGRPSEISSILYSCGIISRDSPSAVVPYIKNLVKMGILKEIKVYGKRGVIYRMASPVFAVFYYLSDKYEMDYGIPPFEVMAENIIRVHSLCYEDFVVGLISHILGGYLRYSQEPEIDGIIVDRKERPMAVVEVKSSALTKSDVYKFVNKAENIGGKRFVIAKNKIEYEDVSVLTPHDLRNVVLRWEL